jgi:CO/xanthine dehydrogenase FAD-binding subunit
MKPAPFQYVAPRSIAETITLLKAHGPEAKLLAGGQSLVPLMHMRLVRPSLIVDLNRVEELGYLREQDGTVAIGAMVRQRTAEVSPLVRTRLPLLAEALTFVGHPQIRNRGTVGGSIAHADPSGELPAVVAILDATIHVRGPQGRRQLGPAEFFQSYLTTALGPDELVEAIEVPVHDHWGTAFLEVARRHGDYALVGAAALVSMLGDRCREARLCFTGVGPAPVRIADAEAILAGKRITAKLLAEVVHIVTERLDPETDIHASATYRKEVAGVLAARALRAAMDRAQTKNAP